MSIDSNKLNAMLDEQDALRARQRAATSPNVTSAQMGEAIRLGRQQGIPPMVVADDMQGFSERSRLDQVQQAAQDSPALGRWMQKPENAPFAREDIGNLSKLTKAISRTFQVTQDHGVAAGFKTWRNHLADWKNIGEGGETGNRATPQPFYIEELASSAHAGLKRAESKYVWAADALTPASLKAYQPEHERQFGTASQLAKIERQAQAREMGFSDETQAAFEGLNAARGKGPLAAASAWLQNPRAIGITFSQSIGMGADALVATMATGGGSKLATMGASGGGSFGVEYGASMQEVLEESGVDVTDPIQVAAALRNPELMAAAKQKAATRGFIIGATDFVFAGMAGKFLQNANRNMRSAAWRTGAEGVTQMGGEALGELGAQLATEDEVDWVEVAGEAIAGLPFAGAEVHANYGTARANGELRYQQQRINGEMNKALASAAGARQFGDILDAAQATGLSKASPEAFAGLLGESIPPDANVYLSLDSARTLFQDGLEEFIGEFAGGEAAGTISDVAASGGDLVIPVADFIAKVAGRADAAEIARHVRLDADHVSRAEMESDEFMAQWIDQIAPYDTSEAAERATPEQTASANQVAQDVAGMLIASGRYRKSDAELQGKLWGRFFGRLADRTGQDAFDLYQRYSLRINGNAGPQAANKRKPNTLDPRTDAMLTAIRTGTIPGGREVFGDSLLSFLVGKRGVRDDGGELSNMAAGKQRPVLINNVDGLTLDEARARAVEAGYLRDVGAEQDGVSTSGIDDLLEAMRSEFSGNPVYTETNADADKLAWRNEALALQRQIDDSTKLRDMTSEEFGALSNQEIHDILNPSAWQRMREGAHNLYQWVFHGTPHTVDRFRLDKIGTGEGMQAFGWGMYFASRKEIAEHYRDQLSDFEIRVTDKRGNVFDPLAHPSEVVRGAATVLADNNGNVDAAIADARRKVERYPADRVVAQYEDLLTEWSQDGLEYSRSEGNLYRADIPEDSDLLDWDKPLSEQPEKVQEALRDVLGPLGSYAPYPGSEIYRQIEAIKGSDRAASEALLAAGVPGLRYLDGNSRDAGEGSHNYVIWGEEVISAPEQVLFQAAKSEPENTLESPEFKQWFGDRSIEQLEAHYAALTNDKEENLTDDGHRIDTDLVRELSPDYVADRSRSQELHPYASALTKELFKRALVRPVQAGREPVVAFLAGGGGSGKSSATSGILDAINADIVMDGTFSNLANARRDIEAVLASDRKASVAYVYRSPDKSVDGAITRAIRMGRPVPVWVLAEAHAGSPNVAKTIASEYNDDDRVEVAAIWNDGDKRDVRPMSIQEIPDVDQREAEQIFQFAVEQADADGTIQEKLRDAFLSPRPLDSSGGGQSQTQSGARGRNPVTLNQDPAAGGVSASVTPRGQLRIATDGTMAIDLFAKADMSTFLHESMHFFLEVMQDVAETSPEVKADIDMMLAWTGNDGGAITTGQHEQIARGFEAYLREGKVPAPELRGMFARFRAWLMDVYRALSQLNVELSDDVRGVFDRMLASDAEIDAAQARQEMHGPMELTDEARAILTPAQWEAYAAATRDAAEEAKAEVLAKLLKAHRRERENWWKAERAEIKTQVEAEFDALPVVRAWRILSGSKKLDAEALPDALRNIKLDRAELLRRYGQAWLNDNLLRLRVYAAEGGLSPELAAPMLGFGSGDELVKSLATVKDLQARIEAEADSRMIERHGDPMLDGSLPEEAMKAVHNSARVRVLEQELAILGQLANQPVPPVRAIREWARRKVADTVARQLRSNDYLVAERRAARQAMQAAAKGNYAAALTAKRQQAMQAALYSEAIKARELVKKRAAAFKRAGKSSTRERVGKVAGKPYLDALDALLDTYALHDAKGPQDVTRAALREWVNDMQTSGRDTAIADSVLMAVESNETIDLRDLTVAGIDELYEAIQNVLHHAREEGKIRTLNGDLEWDAVKAGMLETLSRLEARSATGLTDADRNMLEKIRDMKDAGWNWVLQPETVIEWLDGGTVGIFHDVLWNQSEVAEAKKNELKRMVGNKLKAALDALPAAERKALDDTHFIAGLGRNLSGHTILSALLNMGNASNRDKLMRGGVVLGDDIVPLTPEVVADMLSKLSGAQVNLAQEIWDSVNLLWPEIVAMQEAAAGFAPPKIEAEPITVMTKDGSVALRGGYFPAAYDPKGTRAGQQAEKTENVRQLAGATPISATTSKGYLQARTVVVGPLLLDYHAVLSRHLDGVMSDIAYRQFLRQALKVLKDPDIRRGIDNRIGANATRILQTAFERGAVGQYTLAPQMFGPWQKVVDNGLANITSAALGFRATLAAANIATVPVLAMARMSPWQVMRGIVSYYFGNGANVVDNMRANINTIHALSPMMQRRAEARSVEYGAVLDTLRGERGFRKQMIEAALAMQQWTVPLAENAVWMGKYQAELEAGKGPAEAAIAADKVIRQTQMKSAAKDLSMAEGNPYLRAMMMFAGPLVIINNRLQESGLRGLRGDVESPGQAIGVWFAMAMGGAWLFELMMGRGPDDEDDDDDIDAWDWVQWAGLKMGLLPFAGYPIMREIAGYMDSGFVRPHPIVDSGKALTDVGAAAWDAGNDLFAGEDVDGEKLAKSAVRAGGVAYGLPSNQMLRSGQYLMEVSQGERVPENPAKEAWYLMQGPPKE